MQTDLVVVSLSLTITSKPTRYTGIPRAFLVTVKDRVEPQKMVYRAREKVKARNPLSGSQSKHCDTCVALLTGSWN